MNEMTEEGIVSVMSDHQAASSSPDCPQCPQHILTGAEAAVSYAQFCEAFGFSVGPSGARALLLFYELWGPSGTLVQRGQASNCLAQGQHPEPLLFDHQGYLSSVLEVCEEVSYIMLYCNYTPCQECCQTMASFLLRYPWMRLDVLFSQLYHTAPSQPYSLDNQTGLRSLAALWPRLTLSPISGAAWGHLLRCFVRDVPPSALQFPLLPERVEADRVNAIQISDITGIGPAFLDLPLRTDTEHVERTHTPQALTLLPPPHLTTSMCISTPHPRPPGRLVEIVWEVEREVRTAVSQSQHRDSKRRRRSRRK
ncbi:putative C-_U-editing enzyme APOBEC-4 [Coregonus clupeaformis]|uniref:putative C->U-editing enzyme APOBEC-4 n=1 Tax=Coregonus clupeaformis TaxID=59861 RepID=UPI001E1C3BA4|nr:putative C->U-editing enzyme APOBEC-4 [Coregonus clupeaformis]